MNTFKREWHFSLNCSDELRAEIYDLCRVRQYIDIHTAGGGPRLDGDYRVIPGEHMLNVRATGAGVTALMRLLRKHNAREVVRI